MTVTSFFPGRIRLRSPVFRDDKLCERASALLMRSGAVLSVERNSVTGSVLVRYDPSKIPVERIAGIKDLLMRLDAEAGRYRNGEGEKIEALLGEIEKAVSCW